MHERIIHLIAYDRLKRELLEASNRLSNANIITDDLEPLFEDQNRFKSLLGALEWKLGYLSEVQQKRLLSEKNIGSVFEDVEMLLRDIRKKIMR
jgi:hypothetical protein